MKTAFHFLYASLLVLVSTPLSQGNLSYNVIEDKLEECADWAEQGECSKNPRYMEENCPASCKWQASEDERTKKAIEEKLENIESFFDLEAEDIDGEVLKFDQFKGKVTVIANVASFCGYTESHYKGLVDLYSQFKASAIGFNILAFPCNQFGEQEPNQCHSIKEFALSKGVEFTMMNKVDVNGSEASPVYLFLKKVAGPPRIIWNFATYYVVRPDGTVNSYSGVEPTELKDVILEAMGMDKDEL